MPLAHEQAAAHPKQACYDAPTTTARRRSIAWGPDLAPLSMLTECET